MFSLRSLTATALLAGAALAQDCVLQVPPNPLTSAGLTTPYQVSGCDQRTLDTASFVECAIYDGAASISVYHPLIINAGDKNGTGFIPPVPATVPSGATVACWFGTNGDSLTLSGATGGCVNGLGKSIFGQFASCNGDVFMKTVEAAALAGKLTVPAPAAGIGGQCPTTRDFRIVDQDQSDNVVTTYLLAGNVLSQNTPALSKASTASKNATVLSNGSDNGLVDDFIDPALGCTPWMVSSVTAPTGMTPALALNELQGNSYPPAGGPALVPLNDPMVLVGTQQSLEKVNLYRAAVGQPLAATAADASGTTYCKNFMVAGIFIQGNAALFAGKTSPAPDVANNLYTFLAQRFATSLGADDGLNCLGIFNFAQPVTEGLDGNGVVTSASINTAPLTSILNGQKIANGTVSTASLSSTPNLATVVTATSIGHRPSHRVYSSRPTGLSNARTTTPTVPLSSAAKGKIVSSSAPAGVVKLSSLMSSFFSSVVSGAIPNPTTPLQIPSASSSVKGAGKNTPTTLITSVANAAPSSTVPAVSSTGACSFSKNAHGLVFVGTTAYFPIPSEFAQFVEGAL